MSQSLAPAKRLQQNTHHNPHEMAEKERQVRHRAKRMIAMTTLGNMLGAQAIKIRGFCSVVSLDGIVARKNSPHLPFAHDLVKFICKGMSCDADFEVIYAVDRVREQAKIFFEAQKPRDSMGVALHQGLWHIWDNDVFFCGGDQAASAAFEEGGAVEPSGFTRLFIEKLDSLIGPSKITPTLINMVDYLSERRERVDELQV